MKKINAAVIGCGRIAWQWDYSGKHTFNTHAKAYAANPNVNLVACADPIFSNAQRLVVRYPAVTPYRDYKKMLSREAVDIVSVCTPPASHFEVLTYLLNKTKVRYILAEKPLTIDFLQAKRILALAKKKRAYIALNYYRRFDSTLRKLQEFLSHKSLGNLQWGNVIYYGSIKENAIHLLDLLDYLGFTLTYGKRDSKRIFEVFTSYGIPLTFQAFENKNYGYLEVDLFFKKGRIRVGDYSETEIFKAAPSRDYPGYRDLRLIKKYPSTVTQVMQYAVGNMVQHFLKRTTEYGFLEREIRLMKLIDTIIA